MKLNILHVADLHCNIDDDLYLKNIGMALCKDVEEQATTGIKSDIICITGDLIIIGEHVVLEAATKIGAGARPLSS
jgi:predicted MPP superfamily phosphohydrolase